MSWLPKRGTAHPDHTAHNAQVSQPLHFENVFKQIRARKVSFSLFLFFSPPLMLRISHTRHRDGPEIGRLWANLVQILCCGGSSAHSDKEGLPPTRVVQARAPPVQPVSKISPPAAVRGRYGAPQQQSVFHKPPPPTAPRQSSKVKDDWPLDLPRTCNNRNVTNNHTVDVARLGRPPVQTVDWEGLRSERALNQMYRRNKKFPPHQVNKPSERWTTGRRGIENLVE